MIPPEDHEALEETIEVLKDADLMESLGKSEEDVKAGRVSNWRDVKRKLRLG